MRKIYRFTEKTLRFCRWSRHPYASFCSIGRVVTIGAVDKTIADASLDKTKGLQSSEKYVFSLAGRARMCSIFMARSLFASGPPGIALNYDLWHGSAVEAAGISFPTFAKCGKLLLYIEDNKAHPMC